MEYLLVHFPESRKVLVDGNEAGYTNETFPVDRGTHTIKLDGPADYHPKSIRRKIVNTTLVKPLEVQFEKDL